MTCRKQLDGRFKAQVNLETITNQQSSSQLASVYAVYPSSEWTAKEIESPFLPDPLSKICQIHANGGRAMNCITKNRHRRYRLMD